MAEMFKFDVPDLYVKDYQNDFKERQGSLLNALEAAEKDCSDIITKVKNRKEKPVHTLHQRAITKSYRGKESIFKAPETSLFDTKFKRFCKKSNSPKWLKYSLNDVSAEDMSESSNRRAAFSFLEELQNRKGAGEEKVDIGGGFKPVFKKPEENSNVNEEEVSGKKEYDFGKKIIKKKEKMVGHSSTDSSKIKLSHLEDEDGE